MKTFRISLFLVVWGYGACFVGRTEADNFDVIDASPGNILRFAEQLYREGDYLRAIGEYQRYFFFVPSKADSVLYRIGQCYRSAGQMDKAIISFSKILHDYPTSRLVAATSYQIYYTYVLMGRYGDALVDLRKNLNGITIQTDQWKMQSLIGIIYLKQRRWDDAGQLSHGLNISAFDEASKNMALSLMRYAEEGKHLPYKSPMGAGVLSTLIPGSGKIYCERYGDGFYSFLLIGATAWAAYDGFRREHERSVKGWIFGTFSGLLYVGNIYGSAIAVQVYNHTIDDDLWAKVQAEIRYPDF